MSETDTLESEAPEAVGTHDEVMLAITKRNTTIKRQREQIAKLQHALDTLRARRSDELLRALDENKLYGADLRTAREKLRAEKSQAKAAAAELYELQCEMARLIEVGETLLSNYNALLRDHRALISERNKLPTSPSRPQPATKVEVWRRPPRTMKLPLVVLSRQPDGSHAEDCSCAECLIRKAP